MDTSALTNTSIRQNGIMKSVKSSQFSLEVEQLKNNQEINQGNKLRQLNLYLDQEGILLVGRRLTTANIPHEAKHQLILPKPYTSELIKKSQSQTMRKSEHKIFC